MIDPMRLAASLQADQRARWRWGEEVRVEDYLEQQPILQDDPSAVLDLIRTEVVMRQERGDSPRLDEYLQRFTRFDAQLRSLFMALEKRDGFPRTRAVSSYGSIPIGDHDLICVASAAGLNDVPGYEILAELGMGGMGIVYKARQLSLNRLVALKMLLSGGRESPSCKTRFRTEAEAVARLAHPNIVQIHEIGEHAGRPFLSLEYVNGGTLDDQAKEHSLPEGEIAQLMETIARAMHHAHERGILHRDLKPSNVLLSTDGTPKITDFGLAKLLDEKHGPTRSEAVIGTPSYMSPEQALGNTRLIGVPSDVYSLGAILYELLTGRAPFRGNTMLQTLEQVRTQDAIPPRRLRRDVSRDLETICLKCLEKEPGRRYARAADLADDLRRFIVGLPVAARPIPSWQRLWRMVGRRPILLARGVGIAAAVCILATAVWYQSVSGQLLVHRNSQLERQFVERRNEALFYGLLSSDQGALFRGNESATTWKAAESSARKALVLAGLSPESDEGGWSVWVSTERRARVGEDCYTLLLVLASARTSRRDGEPKDKERYREALRLLERARGLGIVTRVWYLRRAIYLEKLGEKAEAARAREQARAQEPRGALDLFLAGEELCRRGAWEDAANYFDRALAVDPGHFWSQFFLAVCRLQAKKWEAARAGLNTCLIQQPDFVWGYLFRSFANEELRAFVEAEADFDQALALHPGDDARYVLFLMRGARRYYQMAWHQAAEDFRSAKNLKPDQYNAYLNLAQVYLAQKEFAAAEEQWRQALRLKVPLRVVVSYHVERGRSLTRTGRNEEAMRACEEALSIDPEYPPAHEVRGLVLLGQERWEEAERAFDSYLRKCGQGVTDIYRARGQARMKRGRFPEAIEDYTRVLECSPDGEIYQHRGWAHFFADASKLALRDFSRAIELAPQQGDAWIGRGLAWVMLGDYPAAVSDAEFALRREPTSPPMMLNIACIFAQAAARGETDEDQEDRLALTARYRRQAVQAVRETLRLVRPEERLRFWQDKVLTDRALAPIRGKDGLDKLKPMVFPPQTPWFPGGCSP